MYVWIWQHLPGGTAAKLTQAVLIVAVVSALLLFVVFPFVEPHLPFAHVTVN